MRAPASGTVDLGSADAILRGAGASASLGRAAGGDLDGAGIADIVAAGSMAAGGGYRSGAAYVFYGPLTGTMSTDGAHVTIEGEAMYDCLSAVGFVEDADGAPAIVLGSEGWYTSGGAFLSRAGGL